MTASSRTQHTLLTLVAIIAIIAGFVGTGAWLINRPEALRHALAIANVRSPWKITLGHFTWSPLHNDITLTAVEAHEPKTGKRITVDRAFISYQPFGILRGKLTLDAARFENVHITLPPAPEPARPPKRKRINLAKLLLLKHLLIEEARIQGLSLDFGKGLALASDEIVLSLVPNIFGDSRLRITTNGIDLRKEERSIISAGLLSLSTSTRLERWRNSFPYLNAITGKLLLQDTILEELPIEKVKARISLQDDLLSLSRLSLSIRGRELIGSLGANIATQAFDLGIDIPKPITLPYIGKRSQVVDTAGALSGSIALNGTGFLPRETSGEGSLSLTHRFDASPDAPVTVVSKLAWTQGRVQLQETTLQAGEATAAITGTIDLAGRAFDLHAEPEQFPLEHVFEKFQNPHLKKIFGPADATIDLTGWGKQINCAIHGTAFNAGWKPIAAEKAIVDMEITYDNLLLTGTILQGGQEHGKADLAVHYKEKLPDGTRNKDIDLTARIWDLNLKDPLSDYLVEGTGNGTITLQGPQTAFHGLVQASITDGAIHSFPFDFAKSDIDLSRTELRFYNMQLALPTVQSTDLPGEVFAAISPDKLHFQGDPFPGFTLDASYRYHDTSWILSKISWKDPQATLEALKLSGQITSGGPMDLILRGEVNAHLLPLITSDIREGTGPLGIDLNVRGVSANPQLFGHIDFQKNLIDLRHPRITLEELEGALRFQASRIFFEDVRAGVGEGTVNLAGSVDHQAYTLAAADLALHTSSMIYRDEDRTLMLEFEGNLELTGRFPQPTLSGTMNILDGRYTKDFTIIDMIAGKKKRQLAREEEAITFDPKLALAIRNTGDMAIRNNVGDIWLNVNIEAAGTRTKPVISGSINTTEGEIHYLGLQFDITKGFVEFRGNLATPYLEMHADREINIYNVDLVLYGPTDNLALDLSATSPSGPLEKRDVVSLIVFGTTEQELAAAQRAGGRLTTSMVAQSVSSLIERPIAKFTKLDYFRLEAPEASSENLSRLNIGKEISDRLTVQFATDIGVDNAVQTFAAEYLITDNLLIKGSRSTDSNYELNGILRFRLR